MDANYLIELARDHHPLPRTLSTRTRDFLLNLEDNLAKLTAAILPTGSNMPPRPSLYLSEPPSSSHLLSPGVRASAQHAGPVPVPQFHLRPQAEEMTSFFTTAMLPSGCSMPLLPPLILSEQPSSIHFIPTGVRSYEQLPGPYSTISIRDSSRPLAEEMTPTVTAAMLPTGSRMPLFHPLSPGVRSSAAGAVRVPQSHSQHHHPGPAGCLVCISALPLPACTRNTPSPPSSLRALPPQTLSTLATPPQLRRPLY